MKYVIKKEQYTLLFDYEKDEATSSFSIYQLIYDIEDVGSNEIEVLNKLKPFCTGFIKWDGCLDINLNKHYCGYSTELQEIIKDIYLFASCTIKGFDLELADFQNIK